MRPPLILHAFVAASLALTSLATARRHTSGPDVAPRPNRAVVHVGQPGETTTISGQVAWPGGALVRVSGPLVLAPGATLHIGAGARIEAVANAEIVVPRDSRIVAKGSMLEPVVFGCAAAAAFQGCWQGLEIHGNAQLNAGAAASPPARGSGAAGCAQLASAGGLFYGGCDDQDSSGVLRYVRVENAARGLRLLGVGSTTVVEFVQVVASGADGMAIVGGQVPVRHVLLSANRGFGLSWNGGWRGKGQFVVVQQDPGGSLGGLLGSNDAGAGEDALPRSQPELYNLTLVANGSPTFYAARFERGTAGVVANTVHYKTEIALDIDDVSTCLQFQQSALRLRHWTTLAAVGSVSPEGAPAPCPAEGAIVGDAASGNFLLTSQTAIAGLFVNINALAEADLRPRPFTFAATTPGDTPPNDGFFDPAATYRGAMPSANRQLSNIPWYVGWTVPGRVVPDPGVDGAGSPFN